MSQSREEWLSEMIETLGVDREDVLEVAAMFFDAIDDRLADMAAAYEGGNLVELTRLVHGLKGDAANIGFKRSSAVARNLEAQCRDGAIDDFERQFAALKTAVTEQRRAIGLDSRADADPGKDDSSPA